MHPLLDQGVVAPGELEQGHHVAQGHLLGDEPGHDVRLVDGHVDAHGRGEHPPVPGILDPGDGPGDAVLEARQAHGHEVRLVGARHGGHDIGVADARLLQDGRFRSVARNQRFAGQRLVKCREPRGAAFDDPDTMPRGQEQGRQMRPYLPSAHDNYVHGSLPT